MRRTWVKMDKVIHLNTKILTTLIKATDPTKNRKASKRSTGMEARFRSITKS